MSWVKLPRSAGKSQHSWNKHKVPASDGILFSRKDDGDAVRVIVVYAQPSGQDEPDNPPGDETPLDADLAMQPASSESAEPPPDTSSQSGPRALDPQAAAEPFNDAALEVPPPAGTMARNDSWVPLDQGASGQLGCFSFIGPPTVVKEGKTNQDFAFCLETCDVQGEPWLVCGVADGVTNAAWQVRGAQQAAASFVSTVVALLGEDSDPATRLITPAGQQLFASRFTKEVVDRLQRDRQRLEHHRLVPPESKNPEFFLSYYFDQEVGTERRETKWFLSTLLAAALGPRGGFALLVGDGVMRIDRHRHDTWDRQLLPLPLQQDSGAVPARGPATVISAALTTGTVQAAMYPLLPEGADTLAVLFSTDGLLKTPENQLDTVDPQSSEDCEQFIRELCIRPQGRVYPDNLSMAFCRRKVSA